PTVQVRTRRAGGALGPIKPVTPAGAGLIGYKLAVEPDGDAVVAWDRVLSGKRVVQARRRAADGTLGAIVTLSYAGADAFHPDVAVAPSGAATVAWARRTSATKLTVQTRTIGAGTALSATQNLSAPVDAVQQTRVTVDDAGDAVVAWLQNAGGAWTIASRARRADTTLGIVQTISTPGVPPDSLETAGDPSGRTAYSWIEGSGSGPSAMGRIRQAGGSLGPRFVVATGAADARPGLDAGGDAVFAWTAKGTTRAVRMRRRTVGGTLGTVRTLSDRSVDSALPELAVDAAGKATVAWWAQGALEARTVTAGGTVGAPKHVSGETG
ncbi:MAG TPA: hypothetical protein VF533_07175, partial [Solirubrobacteraceae bacterium]